MGVIGRIYGTVRDTDGNAVKDATVTYTSGNGRTYTTKSDKDGNYYFLEISVTDHADRGKTNTLAKMDQALLDHLRELYPDGTYDYSSAGGKNDRSKARNALAALEKTGIIEYGDDFGVVLHLYDNEKSSGGSATADNLGYDFLFGLLNDTQFSINPDIFYNDFLAELKEKEEAGFFESYYRRQV